MNITHKICMDLVRPMMLPPVKAMQDDQYSRKLEFTLTANNEPWPIPTGISAMIRWYRESDRAGGSYTTLANGTAAYSKNGNVLTVTLTPEVCTYPGRVNLTVMLASASAVVHTFSVVIEVGKNPGLQDSIPAPAPDVYQQLVGEYGVLSARVNNLSKMEEGSSTGDAELIDGRVGHAGKTFANIGNHIRECGRRISTVADVMDKKMGDVDIVLPGSEMQITALPDRVDPRVAVGEVLYMEPNTTWYHAEVDVVGGKMYQVGLQTNKDGYKNHIVVTDKDGVVLGSYVEAITDRYAIINMAITMPAGAAKLYVSMRSGSDTTNFLSKVSVTAYEYIPLQEQIDGVASGVANIEAVTAKMATDVAMVSKKIGDVAMEFSPMGIVASANRVDPRVAVGDVLYMESNTTWYHAEVDVVGGNTYRVGLQTNKDNYKNHIVVTDGDGVVLGSYVEAITDRYAMINMEITVPTNAAKLYVSMHSGADTTKFESKVSVEAGEYISLQKQIDEIAAGSSDISAMKENMGDIAAEWLEVEFGALPDIVSYSATVGNSVYLGANATWRHTEVDISGRKQFRVKGNIPKGTYPSAVVVVDKNGVVLGSYVEPNSEATTYYDITMDVPDGATTLYVSGYTGNDDGTTFCSNIRIWLNEYIPLQKQIDEVRQMADAAESLQFMSIAEFNTMATDSMNVTSPIVLY